MSTVLIDRFIEHHRLPPISRRVFVDALGDKLAAADPETAWSLLEQSIEDRPHLKQPERQKEFPR